jgi:predicted ribosomally synthesized peptide with nif11-like leader
VLKEVQPFAFHHSSERQKQAIAFLEKVKNDYTLRDKISTANNDDDLVSIAKQAGFHPSTEDIWLYEDRSFKRKAALRGWYFHDLAHH